MQGLGRVFDNGNIVPQWNAGQFRQGTVGILSIDHHGNPFGGESNEGEPGLPMLAQDPVMQKDGEAVLGVVLAMPRHG
jgi:hypothetical protein